MFFFQAEIFLPTNVFKQSMDKCNYDDPSLIAMYYDDVLPKEHAFTDHLLTCIQCKEKLLNLERDLFLMKNMPLIELPRKY